MKIYVLMGRSSTGKDTIYKKLLNSNDFGLLPYVLCTTRPKRPGEQEGVEYFFTTNEEFEKDLNEGNIIEYRKYNTVNGVWTYYTKAYEISNQSYLTIGTLESYMSYIKYYGEDVVVPIYIEVDEETLLSRAFEREKESTKNYTEMCRRFVKDSEDFSSNNLSKCGIIKKFENVVLDVCVNAIKDYIRDTITY